MQLQHLGYVWIVASNRPTNFLALTDEAGARLDGSRRLRAPPNIWSPRSLSAPSCGRAVSGENLRQLFGEPRFGRAYTGAIQTAPYSQRRESASHFSGILTMISPLSRGFKSAAVLPTQSLHSPRSLALQFTVAS